MAAPRLLGIDIPMQTAMTEANVTEHVGRFGSNNITYGYRHTVMVSIVFIF